MAYGMHTGSDLLVFFIYILWSFNSFLNFLQYHYACLGRQSRYLANTGASL